jgi:hypothetical protein
MWLSEHESRQLSFAWMVLIQTSSLTGPAEKPNVDSILTNLETFRFPCRTLYIYIYIYRARVGVVVKGLCYTPKDRVFETR